MDDHEQIDLKMTPTVSHPTSCFKFDDDILRARTNECNTHSDASIGSLYTILNLELSFKFSRINISVSENTYRIDLYFYTNMVE